MRNLHYTTCLTSVILQQINIKRIQYYANNRGAKRKSSHTMHLVHACSKYICSLGSFVRRLLFFSLSVKQTGIQTTTALSADALAAAKISQIKDNFSVNFVFFLCAPSRNPKRDTPAVIIYGPVCFCCCCRTVQELCQQIPESQTLVCIVYFFFLIFFSKQIRTVASCLVVRIILPISFKCVSFIERQSSTTF